jgi:hypothetical protein
VHRLAVRDWVCLEGLGINREFGITPGLQRIETTFLFIRTQRRVISL